MRYALLLAALALASCDPGSSANNIAAASAAQAGPAFASGTDQATALVEEVGAPWEGGTRKNALRDMQTGGTVRTLTSMGGSAQIFSRPNGAVWQVRLIAGGAGGCGDIVDVRRALPKLIEGLSPMTDMTAKEQTAIRDALNDPGTRNFTVKGATVSAVGGCRIWLTVTAV